MDLSVENFDIQTISKRSARGVLALISRTFFLQLLSFLSSLAIFTFLLPSDVGIYTAVTAMQRIISFFTDFGLGAALVQKKEAITQEDIRTTFTVQFCVTLAIFFIVVLVKSFLLQFFHLSSSGERLLLVLVFTIFLSSFKIIPSILLERKIQFQRLVIPQIAESFIFNALLVLLLFRGFRLESYSFAFLISSIVGIPFYYAVSPWKIHFGISRKSLKHLHYGIQFQIKNILATIKDDFLTVFLAKFLSFTALGYIGFAQKWSFFIFRFIVDSITKVTFSSYSRMQDNKEYLKKAIEKSLFFVSATISPVVVGLIILSPALVHYIPKWHNKWEPALFSLTFFSLNAMISAISNILVNVLDATGRVKTTLQLMVLWTTLTWALTPILIAIYGYNGVSIASFLVTLSIFLTVHLVKKIVKFNVVQSIYKPLTSTVAMGIVLFLLARFFISNIFSLFAIAAISGLVYVVLLYLLSGEEIKQDYSFIFKKQ